MKLPLEFTDKMNRLLGEKEFDLFIESFNKPRYYGLRVNTLKISVEDFLKTSPFVLEPVPWTRDGFYYEEGSSPGRHPYYYAGLYYIQEPSAMLPGAVLDAQPGEWVLDLCAAPGGKTAQIAAAMQGQGLLVANDINTDRVKALVKNVELCGIRNAIITNETPQKLSESFTGCFDRILIDAPCSGEGMFRKDEEAIRSWERFKCDRCAGMQRDILDYVDRMLKPGGYVVYSTCTFSPEEDEIMISEFLDKHGNYELLEVPKTAGIEDGRPEWSGGNIELRKTARLWPHRIKGEGHFVALLRKSGDKIRENTVNKPECYFTGMNIKQSHPAFNRNRDEKAGGRHQTVQNPAEDAIMLLNTFTEENLNLKIIGNIQVKGNGIYYLPCDSIDLKGLKVAKFGWYLGEASNGRFEPSHSMVIALKKQDIKNTIDFASNSREVFSYLKGETLMIEGKKGFAGICTDGFTMGWAKQTGEMLKNMYPKGWRKLS